jgi:hypothetical protein
MLTIENLTARYGISDRALRRRLDALGPLIAPHIHRGQNNALLFDDGALAILDRLMQVQRETGLGLTEAVERIKSELAHGDPGTAEERPKSVHSSADPAVFTKLIAAYEDRIESWSGTRPISKRSSMRRWPNSRRSRPPGPSTSPAGRRSRLHSWADHEPAIWPTPLPSSILISPNKVVVKMEQPKQPKPEKPTFSETCGEIRAC